MRNGQIARLDGDVADGLDVAGPPHRLRVGRAAGVGSALRRGQPDLERVGLEGLVVFVVGERRRPGEDDQVLGAVLGGDELVLPGGVGG